MGVMPSKRKLSASERAVNVANGLTPTGRVPQPRDKTQFMQGRNLTMPVGRSAPNGGGGDYPVGDYRCRGKKFTPARKNHFLRVVRETGEEALARAEVLVSLSAVKDHLASDPTFRDGLDEAYRQHASIYAKEMKRRGCDGWQEPVFGSQGPQQGTGIVGWVTKYSDRLLLAQAQKFDKKYTPRSVVEQTTTHKGSPSLGLDKLSPASREDLRRILEREECANEPEPEPVSDESEED